MAKIKFGATVVGARGTLGGITFSANKSGPYIKQWARSSTPRSTIQQVQRSTWSTSAREWSAMTNAERTAWETFASTTAPPEVDAFGDDYRISGFAWFTRSTSFRNQAGFTPLIAAPVVYNVHVPLVTQWRIFTTGSASSTRVLYPVGTYTASKWIYVTGAMLNTQGAISPNIKMKRITTDPNPPATTLFFVTRMEELFGTIVLGQRFIWKTYVCDPDGYLSVAVSGFRDTETN